MKNLDELKWKLHGKTYQDAQKIVWGWIKDDVITFKQFQALLSGIVECST